LTATAVAALTRAGAAQARAVKLRPSSTAVTPPYPETLILGVAQQFSPAGTAHLLGGIATETIYAGVYSGVLGVRACDVLRSRRHRRRRRNAADHRAASHFLGVFTSIHDRPAAIDERAEFGHW
jgi:IS30 family transposase